MAKPRKQQTRLAFTPVPSSSPAAQGLNKQIQHRAASVRYEGASPSPMRRKVEFSSPLNHNMPPTPGASAPEAFMLDGGGDDRPTQRSTRSGRQQRISFDTSNARSSQLHNEKRDIFELSSDSDVMPSQPAKRRKISGNGFMSTRKAAKPRPSQSTMDADGEDELIIPAQQPSSSAIRISSSEPDDGSDDMPTAMGTQRRGSRKQKEDDFIVASPSEPSDDDFPVISSGRRTAKTKHDSDPKTPSKGRLKRSRRNEDQEMADIRDDLDDLNDLASESDAQDTSPVFRSTQSIQKDLRSKALEQLKRKRAGQAPESEPEALEDEFDDVLPTSSRSMFQADEDDEEFVEEDDDEPLGVPEGMPLHLTRYASMKPKQLFKFAVEWMVQRKINPLFSMEDDIYRLTFQKLNDEVQGLVSSKFSSSAWTQAFTFSLRGRPEIEVVHVGECQDSCDACNRSKHPATYEIQFKGKPYHPETLDDIDQHDGDDDDDESPASNSDSGDRMTYDHQGREIQPENKVFRCGRFCTANAETAHELHHWRLSLYQAAVRWIEDNGYNEPAKIRKMDRWSTQKKRKYANKVVDEMEAQGFVKKLWKEYENTITRAREARNDRYI